MSIPNGTSSLHKTAATTDEQAATLHRRAAEHHDKKNVADAKACSKSAAESIATAQKHSAAANGLSAK